MTDKMTHYENAIAAVRTAYQIDAELERYEAKSHLAQALSFLTSWNQIEAAHELAYIKDWVLFDEVRTGYCA